MTKEEIEYKSKFMETAARISFRHQANLLQKTFNSMSDAVFILDAAVPPTIIECNQAASALFGYKKSEMLGKTTAFLYAKNKDFKEYQAYMLSTMKKGKSGSPLNLLMKRKDKSIIPTEHAVTQLLDNNGRQIGWFNIVKDLSKKKIVKEETETKKKSRFSRLLDEACSREALSIGDTRYASIVAELNMTKEKLREYADHLEEMVGERTRELREAQERLLRAERLAAIGEFAAMVGHDLRNPLTGIAGATYILKKKLDMEKDEKIRGLLEAIEKSVKHSNKIVTELLEYSREVRPDLTETSPNQLLKDTLTVINVPKNIRLIDLTTDNSKIMVDAQKMQRVFENIIQNAIDAMPKGGELTIKSWEADGRLEIAFTDTGNGISPEKMEKLFKPLFTTKSKGIGLGLPICKRIVEAHEGSIFVESAEGKGATFTVTLPIKPKNNRGGKV